MSFKVSEKNINKTTNCPFDFQCLKEEKFTMCPAVRQIKGNGLFVNPDKYKNCPYLMSFGDSFICNCDVRIEIFSKYNE